jgi:hypothetical protein
MQLGNVIAFLASPAASFMTGVQLQQMSFCQGPQVVPLMALPAVLQGTMWLLMAAPRSHPGSHHGPSSLLLRSPELECA